MPHPEPITVARVGKLRSVRKVGRWESNPPEVEWVSHKKTWFWCLKNRNKLQASVPYSKAGNSGSGE